jgi:hypothetical protein
MRLVTFLVLVLATLFSTGCEILEPEIEIPLLCGITYNGPECGYRLSVESFRRAAVDSSASRP